MARLRLVREQIKELEATRLERLEQAPDEGPSAMGHRQVVGARAR
jgi:hypothetical protein